MIENEGMLESDGLEIREADDPLRVHTPLTSPADFCLSLSSIQN